MLVLVRGIQFLRKRVLENKKEEKMKQKLFLILGVASICFFVISCKPAKAFPTKDIAVQEGAGKKDSFLDLELPVDDPLPEGIPVASSVPVGATTSMIRINATQQRPQYRQPWLQQEPDSFGGLGVVIEGGYVLTTAEMVADATFISFVSADKRETLPAEVFAVDYDANLALLKPKEGQSTSLLDGLVPIAVMDFSHKEQALELWQLREDGAPLITEGKIQGFRVLPVVNMGLPFIVSEVKAALRDLGNSYTLPAVSEGKLAGMLANYYQNDQIGHFIEASVIKRFIEDAFSAGYQGFPKLGILTTDMTDPAMRRYLGVSDEDGGVYVSQMRFAGNGTQGGIQLKDVILSIDDNPIDRRGYYDSKKWGKLAWEHLISSHKVGDTVKMIVLRDGKKAPLEFVLKAPDASTEFISKNLSGQTVPYIIHGGLVFTELSVPYLKSYGEKWISRAPVELMTALINSTEWEKKGTPRLVILADCIPTPATLGYERIGGTVVEEVNGQKITDITALSHALAAVKEGIHVIKISTAPFTIYVAEDAAQKENNVFRAQGLKQLQKLPLPK